MRGLNNSSFIRRRCIVNMPFIQRGSMNLSIKVLTAAVLTAGLLSSYAPAQETKPVTKKHVKREPRHKAEPAATAEQLEQLKQEMQNQINSLKDQLNERDSQLKQAQDAASAAQAAAQAAQATANQEQQSLTENATAVSTLQSTVTDLKNNQTNLVTTIQDNQAAVKKAMENPDVLHYKGITLSPAGSFIAAETVWRQGATGGGLNTQFTGVPLQYSDYAQLSEFQGSGRQSRLALKATGKLDNMTLTGYYEMDWLGTGITSNNNQSNSYVLRQRQLWADAKLNNGWDFSGGQGWSLATETTQGLTRGTEILPATIDPQYEAGFVWTRQYSFRVTKAFDNKFFFGVSAENAETLNPAGQNTPSNLLIGTVGNTGGLYDNQSNYSFNLTPDFIAKIAIQPGWGHWELFGIGRSFRDRIYSTPAFPVPAPYNNTVWGGGAGGGFRGPLVTKKLTIGLKGLYGEGVGRYGDSTIADVTIRPNGTLSPLHGFSALSTVEANPTNRLMLYFNYGGDYIGRDWVVDRDSLDANYGKEVGYGTYTVNMSGCNTEVSSTSANSTSNPAGAPANCGANNKDTQEFTAGWWYNIYAGPKGRLRQGFQYSLWRRDLWSGASSVANPDGAAHGDDNMWFTSFRYYLP